MFCGRELSKRGMARHLAACPARSEAMLAAGQKRGKEETLVHLRVQDAEWIVYWLHLEVRGAATLADLDDYLRAIWLECCGHLSQFSIGGWGGDEIPMQTKIARAFSPGVELTHIYDFGTSSYTQIAMVGERTGKPLTTHPIVLLARNNQPEAYCIECGQPATRLCLECMYEEDKPGTLCDEHAAVHPHENYGEPVSLVNSPRVGLCAYDGPATPPY